MKGCRRSACLTTILTAVPRLAYAGEAAHGSAGGHVAGASQAQWILLGCALINFALFVYLMRRFTGRPISDFLRARRDRVRRAMEEAAEAKREADRLKAEYEARAAALDRTREKMVEEMRAIAEADRAKTLAAVKQASERLLRDAERTAQSDLERAKRELRSQAAAVAARVAREAIERRLEVDDRRRLVHDFLEAVGRRP